MKTKYFIKLAVYITLMFYIIINMACGAGSVMIDIEKEPMINLKEGDTILVLPFGFENISTSKDFYTDGSLDFSTELIKKLSTDSKGSVIDREKASDIYRDYFPEGIDENALSAGIFKEISKDLNIEFIITGDILFETIDASSFERIEEYDPRVRRYRSYNVWIRRRQYIIDLNYAIYSSHEDSFIKEDRSKSDIVIEEYQQQVYGFWLLMPQMMKDILDTFIPKEIKASRFIMK